VLAPFLAAEVESTLDYARRRLAQRTTASHHCKKISVIIITRGTNCVRGCLWTKFSVKDIMVDVLASKTNFSVKESWIMDGKAIVLYQFPGVGTDLVPGASLIWRKLGINMVRKIVREVYGRKTSLSSSSDTRLTMASSVR